MAKVKKNISKKSIYKKNRKNRRTPKNNYGASPNNDYNEKTQETTRTVRILVHFNCCYDERYTPEPQPFKFHEEGYHTLSLKTWAEFFINLPVIDNIIIEACSAKCKRVQGAGAELCSEDYDVDIIEITEE